MSLFGDVVAGHPVALEIAGGEGVFLEQAIKLRPVALRKARRVCHIAIGHLEQTHQILAFKALARLGEAQHLCGWGAQCALHQRQGHQRGGRQCAHLFVHVE